MERKFRKLAAFAKQQTSYPTVSERENVAIRAKLGELQLIDQSIDDKILKNNNKNESISDISPKVEIQNTLEDTRDELQLLISTANFENSKLLNELDIRVQRLMASYNSLNQTELDQRLANFTVSIEEKLSMYFIELNEKLTKIQSEILGKIVAVFNQSTPEVPAAIKTEPIDEPTGLPINNDTEMRVQAPKRPLNDNAESNGPDGTLTPQRKIIKVKKGVDETKPK